MTTSTNVDRALSFVDTNVLVYAFQKTPSPKTVVAKKLLDELILMQRLRVSTQVLQELFVNLTGKTKPACSFDEVLRILDALAAWPLEVIDYSTIRESIELAKQAKISFWYALIVVAAANSGAIILYTEDLNHGQEIFGVRIFNPFKSPVDLH